jgi:hypothetical protein
MRFAALRRSANVGPIMCALFLTLLIGLQAPASSVGSNLFVSKVAFAKDDEGQKSKGFQKKAVQL